jgi:predicted 3-demethylubiquinone-9 3-methyltransferase (glyoxalase superfamily)
MKKIETGKQKITPFLWFNDKAEEAVNFYTSVFENSRVKNVMRNPGAGDAVLGLDFELEGQEFMALNGGPQFTFTPAISLFVHCSTQAEVDELWEKLSEGGRIEQCGWLQDRYGLSWQIVPDRLGELLRDPDREKAGRVMQAMMGMKKLNIRELEEAANRAPAQAPGA